MKRIFLAAIMLLSVTIYASAIEVSLEIKGGGGVIVNLQNGTILVCPNQSSGCCAVITADVDKDGIIIIKEIMSKSAGSGRIDINGVISADIIHLDLEKGTGVVENVVIH